MVYKGLPIVYNSLLMVLPAFTMVCQWFTMVNNGLQWFTMVYQWFCQNITNPSGSSHEEQLVAKHLTLLPMVYQWVTMVYQWTHVKSMPFSHSLDIATEQFPPNLIYVYIHVNFCFFVGPI